MKSTSPFSWILKLEWGKKNHAPNWLSHFIRLYSMMFFMSQLKGDQLMYQAWDVGDAISIYVSLSPLKFIITCYQITYKDHTKYTPTFQSISMRLIHATYKKYLSNSLHLIINENALWTDKVMLEYFSLSCGRCTLNKKTPKFHKNRLSWE